MHADGEEAVRVDPEVDPAQPVVRGDGLEARVDAPRRRHAADAVTVFVEERSPGAQRCRLRVGQPPESLAEVSLPEAGRRSARVVGIDAHEAPDGDGRARELDRLKAGGSAGKRGDGEGRRQFGYEVTGRGGDD